MQCHQVHCPGSQARTVHSGSQSYYVDNSKRIYSHPREHEHRCNIRDSDLRRHNDLNDCCSSKLVLVLAAGVFSAVVAGVGVVASIEGLVARHRRLRLIAPDLIFKKNEPQIQCFADNRKHIPTTISTIASGTANVKPWLLSASHEYAPPSLTLTLRIVSVPVTRVRSLGSDESAMVHRLFSGQSRQMCPQLRRQLIYGAGVPRTVHWMVKV